MCRSAAGLPAQERSRPRTERWFQKQRRNGTSSAGFSVGPQKGTLVIEVRELDRAHAVVLDVLPDDTMAVQKVPEAIIGEEGRDRSPTLSHVALSSRPGEILRLEARTDDNVHTAVGTWPASVPDHSDSTDQDAVSAALKKFKAKLPSLAGRAVDPES